MFRSPRWLILFLLSLVAVGSWAAEDPEFPLLTPEPAATTSPAAQIKLPETLPATGTAAPPPFGTLEVTIHSVFERTTRRSSILARRIELWVRDWRIASLNKGDPGVIDTFHHRWFTFSPLPLKPGYYFLSIRVFNEGFLSRDFKWKERLVQIGIHPGMTTRVKETVAFNVW